MKKQIWGVMTRDLVNPQCLECCLAARIGIVVAAMIPPILMTTRIVKCRKYSNPLIFRPRTV